MNKNSKRKIEDSPNSSCSRNSRDDDNMMQTPLNSIHTPAIHNNYNNPSSSSSPLSFTVPFPSPSVATPQDFTSSDSVAARDHNNSESPLNRLAKFRYDPKLFSPKYLSPSSSNHETLSSFRSKISTIQSPSSNDIQSTSSFHPTEMSKSIKEQKQSSYYVYYTCRCGEELIISNSKHLLQSVTDIAYLNSLGKTSSNSLESNVYYILNSSKLILDVTKSSLTKSSEQTDAFAPVNAYWSMEDSTCFENLSCSKCNTLIGYSRIFFFMFSKDPLG